MPPRKKYKNTNTEESHMEENTELDWNEAKSHFDAVRQIYQDLEGLTGANTTAALRIVFDPLAKRYNAGERSAELFEKMMDVA